jgi:hypothetical protein
MQAYGLRAGVHYCVANGVTTFLDVDADRYFGLPAKCQSAFSYLVENGAVPDAHVAALSPLTAAKLLVPTDIPDRFPLPTTVPEVRESVLDVIDARTSPWKFIRAWLCQGEAKRDLSRMPLSQVLANLSNKKARVGQYSVPPSHKAVAAFLGTSIVTQSHDQCLPRSIAMVNYLAHYACHPLFVIGVRNNPFEAHAWVQYDGMALNDDVEKISRFTPILAI